MSSSAEKLTEQPGALKGVYGSVPTWVVNLTTFVVGLTSLVLVLLYNYQDNMLYHPTVPGLPRKPAENPTRYKNPMDHHGVPYEDEMVETVDGAKVATWLMLQEQNPEKCPTLIYFHGNAGNMGFRLENSVKMLLNSKLNVLTMDYRGFGDSTGKPSERGLNFDADAVLDYALNHPKLKGSPIILFGRSLGGAVAVSLAERRPDRIAGM